MITNLRIRQKDRAICVGVGLKTDSLTEIKASLAELEELVIAAGADSIGVTHQLVAQFAPSTLIGSGKVLELKEQIADGGASLVAIDHPLTGVQIRNLEDAWGVRVLDRAQIILDIFAQRAQTYEGKLQVELAQMLDQLPRMVDAWLGSLSRQGGGIGTRGPGETALELDRRRIRDRVKQIRKQLESVSNHRSQHRASRRRNRIPSFAMIGYTNSGKSTLLNALTKSQVLTKQQVFATLDPTTRKVHLPAGPPAVVTDTVGFIRKLPTHLIEAFKATLEESADADVLLHVIDLSSDQMETHLDVVQNLIKEFGWADKPVIHVFNKMDQATVDKQFKVKSHPRVFVSAFTGEGLDRLKTAMAEHIQALQGEHELFFPRESEPLIFDLAKGAMIVSKEQGSSGTIVRAKLSNQLLLTWKSFLVDQ